MSIETLERQGTFSDGDYAEEWSNERPPETSSDGAGSMRGNGDSHGGDGEGPCVHDELAVRYGTPDLQSVGVPTLVEHNDLRKGDPKVAQRDCGRTGCKLMITFHPAHGLLQRGMCGDGVQ